MGEELEIDIDMLSYNAIHTWTLNTYQHILEHVMTHAWVMTHRHTHTHRYNIYMLDFEDLPIHIVEYVKTYTCIHTRIYT